ncbi:hypothetical protein EWM64_g7412 [Hericium alpestre]|uniref:Uncharacterized protein n=1 Tax=Hericium alpestre TaxID=135208 RepID=A0A4Y9ZSY9_9AGAM|nr:hypothetical protein EWM64_g7412 [Hericium alpestre]
MGRSAKLHKRKKTASSAMVSAKPDTSANTDASVAAAKKKAGLKEKAGKGKGKAGSEGRVLGSADYVDLMMGGRRRAKAEAEKLPQEEE